MFKYDLETSNILRKSISSAPWFRNTIIGIPIESQQISQYGSDIEAELTKMLSEELARQIDKQILQSMGLKERNIVRQNKIRKIFKSFE